MREVLLVRHGAAVPDAPGGDAQRPLTEAGRNGVRGVGGALAALGLVPDALWHSPYVRTTETAQLLAQALGVAGLVVDQSLVPNGSPERVAAALEKANRRRLMVVSHMPLLPSVIFVLTGARAELGTGTVAHIALSGPHGSTLLGLWPADQLARVR